MLVSYIDYLSLINPYLFLKYPILYLRWYYKYTTQAKPSPGCCCRYATVKLSTGYPQLYIHTVKLSTGYPQAI